MIKQYYEITANMSNTNWIEVNVFYQNSLEFKSTFLLTENLFGIYSNAKIYLLIFFVSMIFCTLFFVQLL
jgi:hypothetical protein